MGATYVVGQVTVKDETKWAEYQREVPATFGAWGAEKVAGGKQFRGLAGSQEHPNLVVLRFPDQESLEDWFDSAEYQALIPLRDSAADVVLTAYTE